MSFSFFFLDILSTNWLTYFIICLLKFCSGIFWFFPLSARKCSGKFGFFAVTSRHKYRFFITQLVEHLVNSTKFCRDNERRGCGMPPQQQKEHMESISSYGFTNIQAWYNLSYTVVSADVLQPEVKFGWNVVRKTTKTTKMRTKVCHEINTQKIENIYITFILRI